MATRHRRPPMLSEAKRRETAALLRALADEIDPDGPLHVQLLKAVGRGLRPDDAAPGTADAEVP